ncbi:MAG: carbon-nitrogen hydrolase family protein [Acidobacteriota bacterium]
MQRRTFLKSAARAGGLAGFGFAGFPLDGGTALNQNLIADEGSTVPIGRPVRVVSIGFKATGRSLEQIAAVVDNEGARGAALIVLPETWRDQNNKGSEETLNGPAVTMMANLARKHRTYLVCPIDRQDGRQRFNSAVLLNRRGQVTAVYNKVFPWFPAFRLTSTVVPGQQILVHQADFGRVGFAICFDIYCPELWKQLPDQGTELVIWPSACTGGKALQAHAINHHYYIVSATQAPDCEVYDITGEEVLRQEGQDITVSRISLDLDRGINSADSIESSLRNIAKRDKLLQERREDVVQEKYLEREDWVCAQGQAPRGQRSGVGARLRARGTARLQESQPPVDEPSSRVGVFRESVVTPSSTTSFRLAGQLDTREFVDGLGTSPGLNKTGRNSISSRARRRSKYDVKKRYHTLAQPKPRSERPSLPS